MVRHALSKGSIYKYNRYMKQSDVDIVRAYRDGDATAFDELVRRYMPRIYTFSYRLSGDQHIAEDVTAETFVKVWKKLDSFDETKSFTSWLFRIARNTAFDIFRKRKDVVFSRMATEDETDITEDIADERDLADREFDKEVSRELLEKSLATLSLTRRSIVLLHDVDGLTFDEIAHVVEKPMNTVKSHYRRALAQLRATVTEGGAPKDLY